MSDDKALGPEDALEKGHSANELPVTTQGSPKIRKPFSNIAVELNEDDLESKGIQKMLLAEISRLESENWELKHFRDECHKKDKNCVRLDARLQKHTMVEILYSICIAVAAALLGLTPSISTSKGKTSIVIIVVSAIVLFSFALLAKWKGGKDEA